MILFPLFYLFFSLASASITQVSFEVGSFNVYYIYNASRTTDVRIMFAKYNATSRSIWFVQVESTSTTKNIACRRISEQRIIVGPNGCSNPQNPALAAVSANCLSNEVEVARRVAVFLNTWH